MSIALSHELKDLKHKLAALEARLDIVEGRPACKCAEVEAPPKRPILSLKKPNG